MFCSHCPLTISKICYKTSICNLMIIRWEGPCVFTSSLQSSDFSLYFQIFWALGTCFEVLLALYIYIYCIFSLYFQIFWAIGTCFEVLLALFIMPTMGWRWLLGLSALPLLIFTMCCFVSRWTYIYRNIQCLHLIPAFNSCT